MQNVQYAALALVSWMAIVGCRSTAVVPSRQVAKTTQEIDAAPANLDSATPVTPVVTPLPRVGPPDGFTSFGSNIRCKQDSDCMIGSVPTCGPCGSCPQILDARIPLVYPRCPPPKPMPRPGDPVEEGPHCSDCPSAPNYVFCAEGFCAGSIKVQEPPMLGQ